MGTFEIEPNGTCKNKQGTGTPENRGEEIIQSEAQRDKHMENTNKNIRDMQDRLRMSTCF